MLDNLLDCHIKYVENLPERRIKDIQKLFDIIEILKTKQKQKTESELVPTLVNYAWSKLRSKAPL